MRLPAKQLLGRQPTTEQKIARCVDVRRLAGDVHVALGNLPERWHHVLLQRLHRQKDAHSSPLTAPTEAIMPDTTTMLILPAMPMSYLVSQAQPEKPSAAIFASYLGATCAPGVSVAFAAAQSSGFKMTIQPAP